MGWSEELRKPWKGCLCLCFFVCLSVNTLQVSFRPSNPAEFKFVWYNIFFTDQLAGCGKNERGGGITAMNEWYVQLQALCINDCQCGCIATVIFKVQRRSTPLSNCRMVNSYTCVILWVLLEAYFHKVSIYVTNVPIVCQMAEIHANHRPTAVKTSYGPDFRGDFFHPTRFISFLSY